MPVKDIGFVSEDPLGFRCWEQPANSAAVGLFSVCPDYKIK
jgi:hypothetical protein